MRGTLRDKRDKRAKHSKGKLNEGEKVKETAQNLSPSAHVKKKKKKKWRNLSSAFHLFSLLFVFQPPPLFSLSFESPANSASVCCMLPWLFLEPDALCYLPVRPTNSGCFVCACVCVRTTVCVGRSFLCI